MAEAFHIIQSHPPNSSMEQRKVFTPSDGEKYPLWWIQNKFKGEHGSTAKGKMVEVVGGNWLDQAPTSLATMAFNHSVRTKEKPWRSQKCLYRYAKVQKT